MAIYSCNHNFVGKSGHAPGTSGAHIRYITRPSAQAHVMAQRMPDNRNAARAWLADQEANSRKNERMIDKIMGALPLELNHQQQEELVRTFAENITQGRAPWFAAIHREGDDANNPHMHLVIRDRDPETKKKVAELSSKGSTEKIVRVMWEQDVNTALEQAGHEVRIDRRSLKDQGIEDRQPTVHIGPKVQGMEAKGYKPQRRAPIVYGPGGTADQKALKILRMREYRDIPRSQHNAKIIDLNAERLKRQQAQMRAEQGNQLERKPDQPERSAVDSSRKPPHLKFEPPKMKPRSAWHELPDAKLRRIWEAPPDHIREAHRKAHNSVTDTVAEKKQPEKSRDFEPSAAPTNRDITAWIAAKAQDSAKFTTHNVAARNVAGENANARKADIQSRAIYDDLERSQRHSVQKGILEKSLDERFGEEKARLQAEARKLDERLKATGLQKRMRDITGKTAADREARKVAQLNLDQINMRTKIERETLQNRQKGEDRAAQVKLQEQEKALSQKLAQERQTRLEGFRERAAPPPSQTQEQRPSPQPAKPRQVPANDRKPPQWQRAPVAEQSNKTPHVQTFEKAAHGSSQEPQRPTDAMRDAARERVLQDLAKAKDRNRDRDRGPSRGR